MPTTPSPSAQGSYGPTGAPVATTATTYTPADLVASLTHTWNGSSLTLTYSYNQDRQRSGVAASDATFLPGGLPANSATYTSNTLNQYTAINSISATYDKRGNFISEGVWTFGYNTENQLISASKSGVTANYFYDPLGRRKWKTVNGVTTAWVLFGDQEIAEYQGSGTIALVRRFIYGPGIDEPIVEVSPSNARSYQYQDALGSVIALSNASGLLTEKYAYGAYGRVVAFGANTAAYRYTGRRWDSETSLYHYRARAYSSSLGRFLQPDPIGISGGLNLYAYVSNDPINLVDPSGLAALGSDFSGDVLNVGYRNPPPSYCVIGCDAHNQLLTTLQRRDAGEPWSWTGNNTFGGILGSGSGSGRGDLFFNQPGLSPTPMWELKVLGAQDAASRQLRSYTDRSRGNLIAGDNNRVFQGLPSLTSETTSLITGVITTYRFYPGSEPGTLLYTLDERNSVAEQINRAMRENPGTWIPVPGPGRRLGPGF